MFRDWGAGYNETEPFAEQLLSSENAKFMISIIVAFL